MSNWNTSLPYISKEVANRVSLIFMSPLGCIFLSHKMNFIYLIDSNRSRIKWFWQVKVRAPFCALEQSEWCRFGANTGSQKRLGLRAPGKSAVPYAIPSPRTSTDVSAVPPRAQSWTSAGSGSGAAFSRLASSRTLAWAPCCCVFYSI